MRILAFGKGNAGQLGVGENPQEHYDKPTFIEGNVWKKVKCGGYHAVALTIQGHLFVWGAGWNGQLGLGKNIQKQLSPRPATILEVGTPVSKIACGTSHTTVLTVDKRVLSWGGESGDWGLRHITFPNGVTVKSIAAGNSFTLAVSDDGQIYSWGTGLDGRLGVGSTRNFRNPQKVTFPTTSIKITRIAAGKGHSLALAGNGQVYSWGCGTKGQLGHGDQEDQFVPVLIESLSDITRIAAGEAHSVALNNKGVVFVWGDGESGQLALPNVTIQNTPVVAATVPEEVIIVRIAAGQLHTLAITEYGDIFAWGNNSFGQLGIGNTENSNSAVFLDTLQDGVFAAKVSAGERHTLILTTDFNRFDRSNVNKYKASLQPPSKPVTQDSGGAVVPNNATTATTTQKRKSARRSVKFNLNAAFSEAEDDLLATGGAEEQVIAGEEEEEEVPTPTKKNDPVPPNEKREGDAILASKKQSRSCGCIIS